jgi:bifunctional non-homologous end joining protein LigD
MTGSGYRWQVSSDVPQPALATLSHQRFWEPGWVYERKLDGQRCLAVRTRSGTKLYSRSGRDVTVAFPEIAEALEQQASTDFVIDGEVVAFEGSRTSFARLQPRIHLSSADKARRSGVPVYFYVFDVLRVDGEDVRGEPLLDRKGRLRELLTFEGPIRYTPHRRNGGEEYFAEACRKGWEGLIAKRADAAYATGRTDRWLKFKCEAGQELVVVGWTDPEGSRVALGALLLAYWDRKGGDDLVYAGKVGTGFSQSVLRDLHAQLSKLGVDETPCTRGSSIPRKGVHWVRPKLVAQVAFTEWTRDGQLRHPRYLGLRTDKKATDVVRE